MVGLARHVRQLGLALGVKLEVGMKRAFSHYIHDHAMLLFVAFQYYCCSSSLEEGIAWELFFTDS